VSPRYVSRGIYRSWSAVLPRAAEIVEETLARTGIRLTLRKLFYKLVSEQLIRNSDSDYTYVGRKTAEGRKDGTFPSLAEDKVTLREGFFFKDPDDTVTWSAKIHSRDRRGGQRYNIMIACEKAGTVPFLMKWYRDTAHIPIVALGGESSVTTWQNVKRFITEDPRILRGLWTIGARQSGVAHGRGPTRGLGLLDLCV
jgi:hypothetical protein